MGNCNFSNDKSKYECKISDSVLPHDSSNPNEYKNYELKVVDYCENEKGSINVKVKKTSENPTGEPETQTGEPETQSGGDSGTPPESEPGKGGIPIGAIVGIVFAVLVIIIVVIIIVLKKVKNKGIEEDVSKMDTELIPA